mgnify:CR=1 FL=1
MATRADAINFLRGINGMEEVGDALFRFEVSYDDGRSQLVFLSVLDDLMVLSSPFASKDDISARKALDLAVIFGVADIGEFYVLRHILFLEDLDESEVVNSISLLAARADTIEEEVGGDRM